MIEGGRRVNVHLSVKGLMEFDALWIFLSKGGLVITIHGKQGEGIGNKKQITRKTKLSRTKEITMKEGRNANTLMKQGKEQTRLERKRRTSLRAEQNLTSKWVLPLYYGYNSHQTIFSW